MRKKARVLLFFGFFLWNPMAGGEGIGDNGGVGEENPASDVDAWADAFRESLIAEGEKYLGAAYAEGAAGPNQFDCSGFVYRVYLDRAGLSLPRSSALIASSGIPIGKGELKTADLIIYDTAGGGKASHVALYMGGDRIIHAASDGPKTGVIISSRSEPYWSRREIGYRRYLDTSYE